MNKSELIQAIADEAELSKRAAAQFVDAFVSVVTQELKDENGRTADHRGAQNAQVPPGQGVERCGKRLNV